MNLFNPFLLNNILNLTLNFLLVWWLQVNGVEMSQMSHEEAVKFLRQCGDDVRLRLYRDATQTPVTALSPSRQHKQIKPILRYPTLTTTT